MAAKYCTLACLFAGAVAIRENNEEIPRFEPDPDNECCAELCSGKQSCIDRCRSHSQDVTQTVMLHVCTRGLCHGLFNRDKVALEEATLTDEEKETLGDESENIFPFGDDASLMETQNLQDELSSMLQFKTDSHDVERKPTCTYICDFCDTFCTSLGTKEVAFGLGHKACKFSCIWNQKAFRKNSDSYCDTCGKANSCEDNTEPDTDHAGKCKPCTGGFESTAGARCSKCQPGTFREAGSSKPCEACADGKYSQAGARTCTPCAAGKKAISKEGTEKEACEACKKGKYSSQEGQTTCTACAAGKKGIATDKAEQESCKDCDENTYQGKTGQTECIKCGKDMLARPGSPKCVHCVENNTVLQGTAEKTKCDKMCPAHWHPKTDRTHCTKCPAGKDGSKLAGTCERCEDGRFNKEATGKECHQCEDNTQSASGYTKCENCSKGSYRDAAAKMKTCEECPGGYYCPKEGEGKTPCGAGNTTDGYTSNTGSKKASDCKPCAAGKYKADDGAGGYTCMYCPVGTWQSEKGSDECQPCDAGTNTSGVGSSAKKECVESECIGTSKCRVCPTNAFRRKSDRKCMYCIPGCDKCDTTSYPESQCEANKCKTGWREVAWKGGAVKCIHCSSDCKKCTKDRCSQCDDGFRVTKKEGTCKACPENCKTCSAQADDVDKCEECKIGSKFDTEKVKCKACDVEDCKEYKDTECGCKTCSEGKEPSKDAKKCVEKSEK